MHLDCISLIPFPAAPGANRPAVSSKGCSHCVGDPHRIRHHCHFWQLLLDCSRWYQFLPATTADATIENADILKVWHQMGTLFSGIYEALKSFLGHHENDILMGISHKFASHAQTFFQI